ncbi:MAG: NfeD family protein [Gammaproteobacteria bacterium]
MNELQLFYWHWLLGGIGLALAEMFLASFTVLWFGLGAILVGILLAIFPSMPLSLQLFLWIVFSAGFAIFWFQYFRPLMVDKTKAGIARDAAIGESGTVIKSPREGSRGIVRFTTPILGEDEWEFICEQTVAEGDRVRIKDFSGNTLIVTKF